LCHGYMAGQDHDDKSVTFHDAVYHNHNKIAKKRIACGQEIDSK
jgi:hypothetical protein